MMGEAFLGFGAFNTKKITGVDTIDFIKNRQLIAKGALVNEALWKKSSENRRRSKQGTNHKGGGVYPPPFFITINEYNWMHIHYPIHLSSLRGLSTIH